MSSPPRSRSLTPLSSPPHPRSLTPQNNASAAHQRRPAAATAPAGAVADAAPRPQNAPSNVAGLILALALIIGGCVLNNISLEFIIRCDWIPPF